MNQPLRDLRVSSWDEINRVLDRFVETGALPSETDGQSLADRIAGGVAFVACGYGNDRVTVEIARYARCLEEIARRAGVPARIHFVGGSFSSEAGDVLKAHWQRVRLQGFDGWGKWDGGVWFDRMFREPMPEGSERSGAMAAEIWRQAVGFSESLSAMIREQGVSLLIPVDVNSDPGNLAASLSVVLASEITGVDVLTLNQVFYWEGGAPAGAGAPAGSGAREEGGERDHYFRNSGNRSFFRLFERILPWNGERWSHLCISKRQSEHLTGRLGFAPERIFRLQTVIADEYFNGFTVEEKSLKRLALACVLNRGRRNIEPVPIDRFLAELPEWVEHPVPVVCGAGPGLTLDPVPPSAFVLLQPTRVSPEKRVDRDCNLIQSLFANALFRAAFEEDPGRTLTLLVTGTVDADQHDEIETLLTAFRDVLCDLPEHLAKRVFIAFSVGRDTHPAFERYGLKRLAVEDFHRLSDLVLYPGDRLGRGLPLLEACATGVPVVCGCLRPEADFNELLGEGFGEEFRIRYTPFPEGEGRGGSPNEIAGLLLDGAWYHEWAAHNRYAVAVRFDERALPGAFESVLQAAVGCGSDSIRYV